MGGDNRSKKLVDIAKTIRSKNAGVDKITFDIIFRDGKFLFWYAGAPTGHGDETKMTIQIGHGTSN